MYRPTGPRELWEEHRQSYTIPPVTFAVKPNQVPLFELDGREDDGRGRHVSQGSAMAAYSQARA